MALDKEFLDNIEVLEKYKTNPSLNDFFDTINKLEKLGQEIYEKSKTPSETSTLHKQVKCLTKKLEDKKNEIAKRTKTQKEFDAVYECIDYLGNHFNSQK